MKPFGYHIKMALSGKSCHRVSEGGSHTERVGFVSRNAAWIPLFSQSINTINSQRYTRLRELKRRPPDGDILVCGSDQIWNPSRQYGLDPAYFLDFARPRQKRLSYAASFGQPTLDPAIKQSPRDCSATWTRFLCARRAARR